MLIKLRAVLGNQRGGTAIEYGLICALVVIASMVAIAGLADATSSMWTGFTTKFVNTPA